MKSGMMKSGTTESGGSMRRAATALTAAAGILACGTLALAEEAVPGGPGEAAVAPAATEAREDPAPPPTTFPAAPVAPVAPAAPISPDSVDERLMAGRDLTLAEILRAGGALSYVMLLLSVAVVASAVYCSMECRTGRVVPRAEHGEVMARLATRDPAGALAAVEGAKSFYARGARAGLSELAASSGGGREGVSSARVGAEALRSLMRASGERDAAVLRARVAVVAQLGALAALVGLLGTLVGMIQAFGIAAREVYEPVLAYAAVFKALVTSFFGVGLATAALACHYVLSHVLERALAQAAFAFEEVVAAARWGSGPGDGGES